MPGSRRISRSAVSLITAAALLAVAGAALAQPSAIKPLRPAPKLASKPPSAVDLYRLYLASDRRFAYAAREFITTWRDDGLAYATATQISNLPPSKSCIVYTAPRSRKGRTILTDRSRREQWTYLPKQNTVVHGFVPQDSAPPEQGSLFNVLLENYVLGAQPKPVVVGGRKAFAIFLKPRNAGRPYDHLWIDPYTGVMLRREKYHADGTLATVSYLADVRYNAPLVGSDFTPSRWAKLNPKTVDEPEQRESHLDPAKLPPSFAGKSVVPKSLDGYVLQGVTLLRSGASVAMHVLYTDGLYQLSLYETPRRGHAPTRLPNGRSVQLAPGQIARVAHKFSYSILTWDTPMMNYTLVADLSERTLARLAQETGTLPQSAQPSRAM